MSESPPDDLFLDKQGFLQVTFSCISYGMGSKSYTSTSTNTVTGVHMSIGSVALYLALRAPLDKKVPWLWIAYVLTLMICGTIMVATTIQPGIKSFVFNRNFPGGPMAFLEADFSDPVETLGDTAYSLANLLADAMLVRIFIIHMVGDAALTIYGPALSAEGHLGR